MSLTVKIGVTVVAAVLWLALILGVGGVQFALALVGFLVSLALLLGAALLTAFVLNKVWES